MAMCAPFLAFQQVSARVRGVQRGLADVERVSRYAPALASLPYSVNMWARPSSSASSSRAIMYRMLERARPKTQRLMV